jgi:hypothetical protein
VIKFWTLFSQRGRIAGVSKLEIITLHRYPEEEEFRGLLMKSEHIQQMKKSVTSIEPTKIDKTDCDKCFKSHIGKICATSRQRLKLCFLEVSELERAREH